MQRHPDRPGELGARVYNIEIKGQMLNGRVERMVNLLMKTMSRLA